MKLGDIANGTEVFLDANIFVYAFAPDPQFGPIAIQLLERIERQEVRGVTSSHVLSDVSHRLMTLEACAAFNWSYAGIAVKLNRHPSEIMKLTQYRAALDAIIAIGVRIVPVTHLQVIAGVALSKQCGLLTNDGVIVAVMQHERLTQIASNDSDFDRVAGLDRFECA